MIEINVNTGTIRWGGYELSVQLTHEQFVAEYPSLQLSDTGYREGGMVWHKYKLPPQKIGDFSVPASLSFVNKLIVGLVIVPERLPRLLTENWQTQLRWIIDAREFLKCHFGKPHTVEISHLLAEEDYLPVELTSQFQDWRYTFDWGIARLCHESLDWEDHLGIGYHRSQQIQTWGEFIKQVELQIQNAEQFEKDCVSSMRLMLEVLQQISSDLDYQRCLPNVGCRSMGLQLPNSRTLVIRISQSRYKHLILQRTDSVDRYIVTMSELNEQLSKML